MPRSYNSASQLIPDTKQKAPHATLNRKLPREGTLREFPYSSEVVTPEEVSWRLCCTNATLIASSLLPGFSPVGICA